MDPNNFNEYDEFDNSDDYTMGFIEGPQTCTELYFLKGTYKIKINQFHSNAGPFTSLSAEILRTDINDDNAPSIMDVFELLDKTYFLEFIVVILGQCGVNIVNKTNKLLHIDGGQSRIYVTAELTTEQEYIKMEDVIESDSRVTDIISLSGIPVVRTQQNFFGVTQALRYCVLHYEVFNNDEFDWNKNVDWYLVYETLVEPYIKVFLNTALKLNTSINNVFDYKEYLTFQVQFCSMRTEKSLYLEIYTLPKSVQGHDVTYDQSNGRLIGISTKNNYSNNDDDIRLSTDIFRICAGTQNLSLLPINSMNVYSSYQNGYPHVMLNELSLENELFENYFLLSRYQYSQVNQRNLIRVDQLLILPTCPFELKDDSDNIYNIDVSYIAFFTPNNEKRTVIQVGDNSNIVGTVCFNFKEPIEASKFTCSITNTYDLSLLPWKFFSAIALSADIPFNDNSKVILMPIRALPTVREYIIMSITTIDNEDNETNINQSHPNIINKKENTVASKKKPFKFWSRGD